MTYRNQEILFGVIALLTGVLLMLHTLNPEYKQMGQDLSMGPMFFPRILFTIWIICSIGVVARAMKLDQERRNFLWIRVLSAFAILLLFVATIDFLGFVVVSTLCFFALSWTIGYRRPVILAIIACVYTVFIDLLFRHALQCYLPSSGHLIQLFGG